MEVKLIKASVSDVPIIKELAHVTWNEHYPAIIGQAQVDYMLDLMYSNKSLEEQMQNGHVFYLIQTNHADIGFISVTETTPGELYLQKIYILGDVQGKGAGISAWKGLMALYNPKSIKLNVNRMNVKAINFYYKLGFNISRVVNFDIGNGYVMEDFEMVKNAT
ncbi:MAG: GNAT family N-acetyltransferase [Flavobacteriales bacterium]